MKTIHLQDLKDTHGDLSTNNEASEIKEVSSRICKNRKNKLPMLIEAKNKIAHDCTVLIPALESLKEDLPGVIDDAESRKNILDDCGTLIDQLSEYKTSIESMCKRFEQPKIRIAAVGKARQGKSTFTKLYTGLKDDSIIHESGSNEGEDITADCTGTICELEHEKMEKNVFRAELFFFTVSEVLEKVNFYLSEIKKCGHTLKSVPEEIRSITLLRSLCNEDTYNALSSEIDYLDSDIKNGILPYFLNTDYITKLKVEKEYNQSKGDEEINDSSTLAKYRDMTDPSKLYLATKKIKVYFDMNSNGVNEGLFDNFVVIDTKGASTAAGLHSNAEMFNAIDESDAVFSIYLPEIQNDAKIDLYEKILKPRYVSGLSSDPTFLKRHFVIINANASQKNIKTENQEKKIEGLGITETCYSGALKTGEALQNWTKSDCFDFANYVILDMLKRISKCVDSYDKQRFRVLNEYSKSINENLQVLIQKLETLKPELFRISGVIQSEIQKSLNGFKKYLNDSKSTELLYNEKDDNEKKDYAELVADKDKCIYTLLTGEKCPKDLNPGDPREEIERAINHLYRKLRYAPIDYITTSECNKEPRYQGDSYDAASYIENIASNVISVLHEIQHNENIQLRINMEKELDEAYSVLVKCFKLDVIFGEKDLKDLFKDEKSPLRFSENKFWYSLHKVYTNENWTALENVENVFSPWHVVWHYAKNSVETLKDKELDAKCRLGMQIIVNDEILRSVIVDLIEKEKLENFFVDHDKTIRRAKHAFYVNLNNILLDINNKYIYELESFFRDNLNLITQDAEYAEKIQKATLWEKIAKTREEVFGYRNKEISKINQD